MSEVIDNERGPEAEADEFSWEAVVSVGIRTTSSGPFAEDVFWQFALGDRLVEVPGSRIESNALAFLSRVFPGLDWRKVGAAMGSTDDRQFRLWESGLHPLPDHEALRARFVALLGRLGAAGDPHPLARRVLEAWGAPERRYHDTEHLAECLMALDEAAPASEERDVAEFALWYHDVVYAPREADNEARSAAWLEADGASVALPEAVIARAARIVRATAHAAASGEEDELASLVCDIDLSILGREPLRFFEFEDSVREEYAHVGDLAFALGRGRFLASLPARARIYVTPWAHGRFEAAARRNIETLLAMPRYAPWRLVRWLPGMGGR